WAFVMISPSSDRTMPVPAPSKTPPRVLTLVSMVTTEVSTRSRIACTSMTPSGVVTGGRATSGLPSSSSSAPTPKSAPAPTGGASLHVHDPLGLGQRRAGNDRPALVVVQRPDPEGGARPDERADDGGHERGRPGAPEGADDPAGSGPGRAGARRGRPRRRLLGRRLLGRGDGRGRPGPAGPLAGRGGGRAQR